MDVTYRYIRRLDRQWNRLDRGNGMSQANFRRLHLDHKPSRRDIHQCLFWVNLIAVRAVGKASSGWSQVRGEAWIWFGRIPWFESKWIHIFRIPIVDQFVVVVVVDFWVYIRYWWELERDFAFVRFDRGIRLVHELDISLDDPKYCSISIQTSKMSQFPTSRLKLLQSLILSRVANKTKDVNSTLKEENWTPSSLRLSFGLFSCLTSWVFGKLAKVDGQSGVNFATQSELDPQASPLLSSSMRIRLSV